MTLLQALGYFVREAVLSLVRSARISLIATLTIALSLFLGGLFYAVGASLAGLLAGWGENLRVVVFLQPGAATGSGQAADLEQKLRSVPWVSSTTWVSSAAATARMKQMYPSLGDVLSADDSDPLPPSIEAALVPERVHDEAAFGAWIQELRADPRVEAIEDDREFLERALGVLALGRAFGIGFGLALLLGAVFTTASVIRLTAYLYLDEIAVMRLVGATEFYVRGPFYFEGLLQGVMGGALAAAALLGSLRMIAGNPSLALWLPGLGQNTPASGQLAALIALGGVAGLLGAVLSLRREKLVAAAEE